MTVIGLILILVFLGWVLYVVQYKAEKLNPTIKLCIKVVIIGTAVILVLYAFGVWDQVRSVKVPHL